MDRRWLAGRDVNPDADLRLFCLPYAGGNAAVYRGWVPAAAPGVQVCPVELPGRGMRFAEPPFHRLPALIAALTEALRAGPLDRPYALFGHSMGALIVFELARAVRRLGLPEPRRLFVSGAGAPDTPPRRPPLHTATDDEVLRRLHELDGTPRELLGNAELMELMLPVLRADFSVLETYAYRAEPPLSVPLTVFGGADDGTVGHAALAGWRAQTVGGARLRMFPGGHFFVRSAEPDVVAAVLTDLERTPDGVGGTSR